MKITALIENTRLQNRNDLEIEHGLSLYIEHGNKKILFDTGASDAFGRNAEKLGIDLHKVDLAIISHHHYDHGGGLPWFLELNSQSPKYPQSSGYSQSPRYSQSPGYPQSSGYPQSPRYSQSSGYPQSSRYPQSPVYLGKKIPGNACFKALGGILKKYIGLDKQLFTDYPDRFIFVEGISEIAPGLFIFTKICHKYPRPKGNLKLLVQKETGWEPDSFEHEVVVVLQDKEELVILTGCAHSGILNMIETVVREFPDMPIKAVLGGFHLAGIPIEHLMPESKKEIQDIATELLKYPVKKVYTGHCTGRKGYEILKSIMGETLEYISTGRSLSL